MASGKDAYEFGDVSKELNRRRAEWVKNTLGSEEYAFGDLTKKAVTGFTGKVSAAFLFSFLAPRFTWYANKRRTTNSET
jgi:hypothetical protein